MCLLICTSPRILLDPYLAHRGYPRTSIVVKTENMALKGMKVASNHFWKWKGGRKSQRENILSTFLSLQPVICQYTNFQIFAYFIFFPIDEIHELVEIFSLQKARYLCLYKMRTLIWHFSFWRKQNYSEKENHRLTSSHQLFEKSNIWKIYPSYRLDETERKMF